jgi:hypothetical protein
LSGKTYGNLKRLQNVWKYFKKNNKKKN